MQLNDNRTFNDIGFIADLPKACLIDSIGSEIPADFKQMFDMTLCGLSNHLLKDVINAYQQLKVKYEPLKIIKPQFEIPLPALQLAVRQLTGKFLISNLFCYYLCTDLSASF